MAVRDEDVNAVRERSDLVQIVSEQVTLKKKGKYFWGCCPFHKEKTASFKVDPALQLYHCFGCGEGGNVFTYVMKTEHLDFGEAVRSVADRIGYSLRYTTSQGERPATKRLYDLNEDAIRFYQYVLNNTDQGKRGLSYLERRGFSTKTIEEFALGVALSSWDTLTKNLIKRGAKPDDLLAVGLSIKGERGLYDRFRSRVIFPIKDLRGRTVAFGGRVLGDQTPKYLNTAETSIFKKSSTLYGLYQAKSEIVKTGTAIVVEGYTDVIALHQEGIKTAVATLGTAFTQEHLSVLSRFAEKVILVFDSDAAGLKAAERSVAYVTEFRMPGLESVRDLLNKGGSEVRVAVLPAGLDPAEMIQKNGRAAFVKAVEDARDFVEFAIERLVGRFNLSSPAGKTKAARRALEVITSLDSAIAQEEYVKLLAEKLGTDLDFVLLELRRMGKLEGHKGPAPTTTGLDIRGFIEKEVLKIALRHPELRAQLDDLDVDSFTTPRNRQIFSALKEHGENAQLERGFAGNAGSSSAISALMLEDITADDVPSYFRDILTKLKEFELQRRINTLRVKLEKLNPINNSEAYDALFDELLKLEMEKRSLKGTKNTLA